MNDDLAAHLARRARALDLDALNVEEAEPQTLRDFAREVLAELAALGLIRGQEEAGCWAGPRPTGH
ncbi:hypothetical protein DAETH_05150 [Deinococcus aetherius]|uniref:Uncharacterized protein n=1 Tax=Deinococcus aetherius TaxID=200252 RepID=A0ABM8AA34_9DEIO|nr:hypothetical protein [Deinococcus aetherius]BDP40546.1 hypothetical protein DAETH_05150 [Deinococcus aetherius]